MRHQHLCRLIEQLEALEAYRKDLRRHITSLLLQSPQAEYLLSVPGVGIITAASLLGMCGDLRRYESSSQLEKFMGLNLYDLSSGRYRGKLHISKRGNEVARCALFLASTGQMRKGRLYYAYTCRQKEKGQPGKKIQIAIARKLLKLLYSLVKREEKFEGRRFYRELKAGDDRSQIKGMRLMAA